MKSLRIFLFASLAIFAVSCSNKNTVTGLPEKVTPTKNLIVMVPDGTSTSLLAVTRWYQRYMTGELDTKLNLDPWICGLVQSRLSNSIIPDSAPAMSGYMTGIPQRAGNISIYPEPHPGQDVVKTDGSRSYQPAATVLEAASLVKGKSAGVVVNVIFPHATPAATSAHTAKRGEYKDIAYQMASHDLDVVFGGGTRILNDEIRQIIRDNGANLYENDIEGFRKATGKTWAIFNNDNMDYELDRDPEKEPSLCEMTTKALEILSKNEKGFFLMIEGSKVDAGAHAKDPIGTVTEFVEFDKAFAVALDFAKKDGNTAVVVLPDHGTSAITLGDANYNGYSSKGLDSMFINMKNYKATAGRLSSLIRKAPDESISEVFKQWTGIELSRAELGSIRKSLGREETDYMKVSNSWNLQSVVSYILTAHTHIGFVSGNHTGEEVFLAVYNPNDQRPCGIITNTELNEYLCKLIGYDKPLSALSDEVFAPADKVFEGCTLSIEDGKDYKTLVVTSNGHTLRVPSFFSVATLDGKSIKTKAPAVYQKENDKFYVDSALGALMK